MYVELSEFNALLDRIIKLVDVVQKNTDLIGGQAVRIKQLEGDSHNHRRKGVDDGT